MIKIDVAKAKDGLSKAGQKTLISGLAVAISLVLSMAIVYFMDIDPLFAFRNMIQGALGSKN
ncbi:MAG: hypothetical protein GX580_08720, partial [Candidatus Hydrogenedens sp.]|nr:hypothetical protein [Candidatus Hydrogenedens sp.]